MYTCKGQAVRHQYYPIETNFFKKGDERKKNSDVLKFMSHVTKKLHNAKDIN